SYSFHTVCLTLRKAPIPTRFPYTTLFRSPLFYSSDFRKLICETFQYFASDIFMCDRTSAEPDGNFDLILFGKEFFRVFKLRVEVMVFNSRGKTDFLDFDDLLLLARFLLFSLLFVLVFAVVHDTGNWRLCIRCNKHEVLFDTVRHLLSFLLRLDSKLGTVLSNQSDFFGTDSIIDKCLILCYL